MKNETNSSNSLEDINVTVFVVRNSKFREKMLLNLYFHLTREYSMKYVTEKV